MQDIESFKCPVCLHTYDTDQRIPKIFPTCGHTICKECLVQVLEMDRPTCPLDKLKFGRDFQDINAFPTNFLGKDLLEIEGKWSRCETHQEPNKMICLMDHQLVCANCIIFGDHQGHQVRLLSDFQGIAKQKKEQLETISDKISKNCHEFMSTFEEKKQKLKEIVEARFKTLRAELTKQEFEIMLKFESIFMNEKTRLESMMKKGSDPSFDIKSKLEEFSNLLASPNIIKLIEEDFSDLEKIVDEKLLVSTNKHTEELSALLAIFEDSLPKEDLLKDLNHVLEPLDQQLLKFKDYIPEELTQIVIPEIHLRIYEDLENEPGILKIEAPRFGGSVKSVKFARAQLEKIKNLKIMISLDSYSIDTKTLALISSLSRHLTSLKSVKIEIGRTDSEEICDRFFLHLLSSIFSHQENIEEIDINIQSCPIRDAGLSFFVEKLLPQCNKLRVLSLESYDIQTKGLFLKTLAEANLSNYPSLEKFHVNLQQSPLNEEYVIPFLSKLPNVKDLLLGLGETSLTDKALEIFATQGLNPLDKLQILDIGLWENKLSDSAIQTFFANIPNSISKLFIGVNDNPITDASLQDFIENRLSLFTDLKELELDVSETALSSELIQKINDLTKKFPRRENENDEDEEDEDFIAQE